MTLALWILVWIVAALLGIALSMWIARRARQALLRSDADGDPLRRAQLELAAQVQRRGTPTEFDYADRPPR